jgi:hypothetical protein
VIVRKKHGLLHGAFYAAELGFSVMPLRPGSNQLLAISDRASWKDVATREPEEIRALFESETDANMEPNVGGYLPDGIVRVDIDCKDGKNGEQVFQDRGIEIPDTLEVLTPNGGRHAYLRYEPNGNIPRFIDPTGAVELLFGHTVLPPSRVLRGEYRWNSNGWEGTLDDVPPAPEALLAVAEEERERRTKLNEKHLEGREKVPLLVEFQELLDRFEQLTGMRPTGRKQKDGSTRYTGRCPAHHDGRPSLGIIHYADGGWLPTCFAGCGTAEILDALGEDIGGFGKPLNRENLNSMTRQVVAAMKKTGIPTMVAKSKRKRGERTQGRRYEKYEHYEKYEPTVSLRTFRTSYPLPLLDKAAYQGRAGRIVSAIEPLTEADPVGLLVSTLTLFGNVIGGPQPSFGAGSSWHRPILFSVLVGESGAAGRKGTAVGAILPLLEIIDEEWIVREAPESGQALVWVNRDGETDDKRLMIVEDEFASILAVMEQGNLKLSQTMRKAWDGKRRLETVGKGKPAVVTNLHVSIVASITPEEVRRKLQATEQANGFGNRHLWFCVERSKELPGSKPIGPGELRHNLVSELTEAITFARSMKNVQRDRKAEKYWFEIYSELTRHVPGMSGAMRARGDAQVLRLSLCYALLDGSRRVRLEHLKAAHALWQYAEQSVYHIFGNALGDPTADRIQTALQDSENGLTRTEISNLLGRNRPAAEIDRALNALAGLKRAYSTMEGNAERWRAIR